MTRRRLPIGIQTFREVREDDCYYVDKTAFVRRLLDEGKHFFLSRPRRFGKSLFLDTLKELFGGNEPLFEGLAIHDRWDWSVCHPVLRLSFGSGHFKEPGYLYTNLMAQLDAVERRAGVSSGYTTGPERFGHLLEALHGKTGRPVALLRRRGRHGDGGAAVPDRLPHHPGRGRPRWRAALSAGLSQAGGAPEPEPKPAPLPGARFVAPDGEQRPALPAAGGQRFRGA